MISGANDKELELANARANIVLMLDNTCYYESWLIIDTYIEQLEEERNNYKELYEKEKEKNEILGQTIVGQQHTIRVLKKHKREQKHNHKQQNKKFKHNWNELKEWAEKMNIDEDYEAVLDKMQEIERK